MYTYQDLLAVGQSEEKRMEFTKGCIHTHKTTNQYKTAQIASDYDKLQNRTITQYRKLLYTMSGKAVPDNYSANFKLPSKFFNRFTTQQTQFLLGNGTTWEKPETEERLGKDFDTRLQEIGKAALVGGVAFGFFNFDHLEVFTVEEFAPLYDEENGALMAGVRFWQVDDSKPLRATLYETDGYTEYAWKTRKAEDGKETVDAIVLQEKRPYIVKVAESEADGTVIYDGENYPTFPIVPLWGNPHRQSEIIGIREQIDAYDLIKSGFANDLDDASQIYWTIQNAGGMDDLDLAKFVERMKTVKAAVVDEQGSTAEAHTLEVPYNAREAILDRLKRDLYDDYMAFNPEAVASGAVTATQIKAAYEPINSKADQFEYCIHDFIDGILAIAGIEDNATFTRSMIVNVQEEIQSIIQAANYLSEEYVVRKIMSLLGDADLVEAVIDEMAVDEYSRFQNDNEEADSNGVEENEQQENR